VARLLPAPGSAGLHTETARPGPGERNWARAGPGAGLRTRGPSAQWGPSGAGSRQLSRGLRASHAWARSCQPCSAAVGSSRAAAGPRQSRRTRQSQQTDQSRQTDQSIGMPVAGPCQSRQTHQFQQTRLRLGHTSS